MVQLDAIDRGRWVILEAADHPVPSDRIAALLIAAGAAPAAVPGLPVRDTIKQVDNRIVERTLPRDSLVELAGPWIFRRDVLQAAVRRAHEGGWTCRTPLDVCLLAAIPVRVLPGELAWPKRR